MKNSSFDTKKVQTIGYNYVEGKPIQVITLHPSMSYSAFGMRSTVEDLIIWSKAVTSKKLLTKKSWAKVLEGGVFGYGYGWHINGNIYEHSGFTSGFNSDILLSPKEKLTIIVLSNTEGNKVATITSMIRQKIITWDAEKFIK